MIIQSMLGLGDNIYQRGFIQSIREPVYLDTPWPELYEDLPNVKPVYRPTRLRTQAKNLARHDRREFSRAARGRGVRLRYTHEGPVAGMAKCLRMKEPKTFTLPSFNAPLPIDVQRPYAVLRPCTVRKEWFNESRNCNPSYIAQAAVMLRQEGYQVISVADLQDGEEWPLGELPEADIQLHKGELDVKQLLTLVEGAGIVVGPVGWIVPACLAYKTPSIIISGGQGGFNHPSIIAPTQYREQASMAFLVPFKMCQCTEKRHECNKSIPQFAQRFRTYLVARGRLGVPPRTPDKV